MDTRTVNYRTLANRLLVVAEQLESTRHFLAHTNVDAPLDWEHSRETERLLITIHDQEALLRLWTSQIDNATGLTRGGE